MLATHLQVAQRNAALLVQLVQHMGAETIGTFLQFTQSMSAEKNSLVGSMQPQIRQSSLHEAFFNSLEPGA